MSFFTNGAQMEIKTNSSLEVLSNGIFALSAKNSQYILCSYSPGHLELIENIIIGNEIVIKNIGLQNGKLYFNVPSENIETIENSEVTEVIDEDAGEIFINYLGVLNPIPNKTPNDITNIKILDTTKQKHINHITNDSSNAQIGDYIVMTTQ